MLAWKVAMRMKSMYHFEFQKEILIFVQFGQSHPILCDLNQKYYFGVLI